MFEFLSGKKNRFIGIDFGTSSIKVVELSYKDQKAHLNNYGVVDLNWASHEDDLKNSPTSFSYEQKLNNALAALLKKMDLESGNAYVSIPAFSGLITIIDLPEMQNEELSKAIQFEAHKYIPSSLDEVAMSWEIVEHYDSTAAQVNGAGKRIRVLLVAAPKRDIERYDRLVSGTSLQVSAIELEPFSISRSLVGEEPGTFFVIDIGSRSTNIILVEKGIIRVNRNIDAGGNEITTAISDSMKISRQRAEDFKKGDKDLLNSTESSIIIPVLELIAGESRRILNAYQEKNKNFKLDKILLSGGTSQMKGLQEFFSRSLNCEILLANPWRKIAVDSQAAPLVNGLGSSFTVAIGLALRGIEEYKRK